MNTTEKENDRIALLRRSNMILEKTKNNYKNYEKERLTLFDFTQSETPNYPMWEHMANCFEDIISLEEKHNIKSNDLEYLEKLSSYIKEQRTREKYGLDENCIFKITDKNGTSFYFITRFCADIFIKNNKKDFAPDAKLEVIKNRNQELDYLLNLIERNF